MKAPDAQVTGLQDHDALLPGAQLAPQLWRRLPQMALIAADLAGYLLVYELFITIVPQGLTTVPVTEPVMLLAAATMALQALASLYPGYRLHPHEHLRRRLLATIPLAGAAALVAGLLAQDAWLAGILLGFQLAALIVQWGLRHLVRGRLMRSGAWGDAVEVIGAPALARSVSDYFTRNWQYGINPIPAHHGTAEGHRPVALYAGHHMPATAELDALRRSHAEVILLADLPNLRISGLCPGALNGRIGMTIIGRNRAGRPLQRVMDLAIAIPALAVAGPIMLLAAIAIRIADPGPVIYRQAREGLGGRTVHVLKLRTMYRDAEQRLNHLLETDLAAREEWARHFKLRNDPRILPGVGRFLRATSCDELPQLFNVIAGNMSIVGPRPFPDYHLAAMDGAFRQKRCSVMPGLTGLWQISDRSNADVELQQQLDNFYIDNRSLWFDGYIVFNTFAAVFRKTGA